MDLQTAFYTIGIIFMIIMLCLVIATLAAILVIKSKINHMQRMVNDKVAAVQHVFDKGSALLRIVRHFIP
jgi:hypothetical protein